MPGRFCGKYADTKMRDWECGGRIKNYECNGSVIGRMEILLFTARFKARARFTYCLSIIAQAARLPQIHDISAQLDNAPAYAAIRPRMAKTHVSHQR